MALPSLSLFPLRTNALRTDSLTSSSLPRKQVRRTQRAIKHVLTERFYAWEEARTLAKGDDEVDLAAGPGGEGVGEGVGEGAGRRAYRSRDFEVCRPVVSWKVCGDVRTWFCFWSVAWRVLRWMASRGWRGDLNAC